MEALETSYCNNSNRKMEAAWTRMQVVQVVKSGQILLVF